jgi:hypothetical protein
MVMTSKLLCCLAAAILGAALVVATPAMAFRGGFGGGFGGGFRGGGFGGFRGGLGGFHGPMFMGRSAFVPGTGRFAAPFAGQRFAVNRLNSRFFFRNRFFPFRHRFVRNNLFFAGVPFGVGWDWPYYGYDYGYGGCWQQVWTGYGYQWINACYNNGYGY